MGLKQWLGRGRRASREEIDEEMRFHLEMKAQLHQQQGLEENESRRQARVDFGNADRVAEDVRRVHRLRWWEDLRQDVRMAWRGVRRHPWAAVCLIAVLSAGIGAATAVFSVIDPILFQPLPYLQGDRLVSVGMVAPIETREFLLGTDYEIWRQRQQAFTAMTSWWDVRSCALTEARPLAMQCARVEANFLSTLGVAPETGRDFTANDDRPDSVPVALISWNVWQRRFGGAGVTGQTIKVDDQPVRVIGVLPRGFLFPTLQSIDVVTPERFDRSRWHAPLTGPPLHVIARMRPGVSLGQARAGMQGLFADALTRVPAGFRHEVDLRLRPLRDFEMQGSVPRAWLMLGLVGLVLLITAANAACLWLARSLSRGRERALRVALGASRSRMIRETLTEGLVSGLLAVLPAALLAGLLLHTLKWLAPAGIPRLAQAALDLRALTGLLLLSCVTTMLAGLVPALQWPRLEQLTGGAGVGGHQSRLRAVMVAAQVALCMVLLSGAVLLLTGLRHLEAAPLGLQPEHVLTASFTLPSGAAMQPEQQLALERRLEARLRALPGTLAVGLSDSMPPGGATRTTLLNVIQVRGQARPAEGTGGTVVWRWVTPGYFRSLGIPFLQGRDFTAQEQTDRSHSIVVSARLARHWWGGGRALGQHLRIGLRGPWYEVVGVTGDVANLGPGRTPQPEFYWLRKFQPDDVMLHRFPRGSERQMTISLRTTLRPQAAESWMGSAFAEMAPGMPVQIARFSTQVKAFTREPRFVTSLSLTLAVLAMLLTALGLYGLVSYFVLQREQEMAVRMALGARPAQLAGMVAGYAARWSLAGLVAGGALCVFLAPLRARLGSLTASAPMAISLLIAAAVLLSISAAAALAPGLRSARVQPMQVLRHE